MSPPFPEQQISIFGNLPVKIGRVSLYPATADDLPFLRRLYREAREEELAAMPWPDAMKDAFCNSQFDLQHRHFVSHFPRAEFLLAGDGRGRAGRLYIDASGEAVHIIDIALLNLARGKGAGTRLLRAIQRRATAIGKPVTLQVLAPNLAAQRLYKRLGFVMGAVPNGNHLPMRWSA